jgi:tetratricopeptide (TPR) repeat protein
MVSWTVRACRRLNAVLAEVACCQRQGGGPGVFGAEMDQLNQILTQTFPSAAQVIVQDEFLGFRRKEQVHVLLVEVLDPQARGTYVVKIGPASLLEKEVAGWESCRPVGLRSDPVFLPLRKGFSGSGMMSLIYGDAHQFLGVETISTLEAAALKAVQFGSPSLTSVGLVLVELYERLGHLFYGQSFIVDPAKEGFVLELRHLDQNLGLWESEAALQAVRWDANTLADSGSGRFLDPVDYLRYVQTVAPWRDEAGKVRTPAGSAADGPRTADLTPRLLRGCAHGDLHGRNVLVGLVHDRVLWPTVFDYEDMSPCNWLGWDFVKLETELKVRAYLEVFPGKGPAAFVRQVQAAEIGLNEQTEACHQARHWPSLVDGQRPADRLGALLLEVRRLAALHLGADRGRPNDWLEEYYFLLACYGITTARFGNLQPRERLAAFLSAGVATARLSWPRQQLERGCEPQQGGQGSSEAQHILQTPWPSYHQPLQMARNWVRSGTQEQKREALELLRGLRAKYAHALAIGGELVLALLEDGRIEEAEQVLHQLEIQFPNLDEEALCRVGRCRKELGDRCLETEDQNTAAQYYQQALAKYRSAYELRHGHYPGINCASLLHLLGRRREAVQTAQELLASREQWLQDSPEDLAVWHPATEAEARLLLEEWEPAAKLYHAVQQSGRLSSQARQSMRHQVERILGGFRNLGITAVGPFQNLDALFPTES